MKKNARYLAGIATVIGFGTLCYYYHQVTLFFFTFIVKKTFHLFYLKYIITEKNEIRERNKKKY